MCPEILMYSLSKCNFIFKKKVLLCVLSVQFRIYTPTVYSLDKLNEPTILGKVRLSTMPCWPRLESIITQETTLSWELPVVNTSGSAH